MSQPPKPVQLTSQTLAAFESYVRIVESVEDDPRVAGPFLWSNANAERTREVGRGRIVAQYWGMPNPSKVPDGLIHDWIGAALIPGTTVAEVLALIQDYDHHADIYQPEVMASKLIHRQGNEFKVYLRLLKKKIITVILDTDHEVRYQPLTRLCWSCRSKTTRIAEVEEAGTAKEKVLPPDSGYGFLWRLYSYWRFEERQDGVVIECRAISLTRDVPFGLGWLIDPIIQKLPEESLIRTLEATRKALQPNLT